MIICSIAGGNHLAYSMALAKSVKENIKNSKFVLCLVENEIHPDAKNCEYFDHIVLAKGLGVPEFSKFILKYNIYESACALKPYLLQYSINHYSQNEKKFVYLDSDIRVYGPFNEMQDLLDKYSIVITPHRLEPQDSQSSISEEITNLKDGVYNAGVLGLNISSSEVKKFLKWWASRLYDYSYIDYNRGLFLDQKWLNLVPCFFKNVYTLTHPGYNMASWNLSQRRVTALGTNKYLVNDQYTLHFFHFSGMFKWLQNSLNEHFPDKADDIHKLISYYKNEYEELGHSKYKDIPWSYDKDTIYRKITDSNENGEKAYDSSSHVVEVIFREKEEEKKSELTIWGRIIKIFKF